MPEFCYLSIAETARAIERRELSPVDLCEAYLSRIELLDPSLRSFLTVLPEAAMARAKEAETAIARNGPKSPLHGVPYGLKDIYDTADVRTTGHSAVTQHRIPSADSECEVRLKAAGGVLLGKLATHEFATGGPSYDVPWPPARNPWRLDRFPGGSSSGAGAAVAAGLLPGALGSDTGGSIRLPAAYCGLVGLKPTFGRVSKRGVFPLSWTLDNCGPLTWTVEDAALMLQAIAGFDPKDPGSADVPVPNFSARLSDGIKGTRIGLVRGFYERDETGADEVVQAMSDAADVLRSLGAEIVDIELPPLALYQACYRVIVMSEAFAIHEPTIRTRVEDYGESFRYRILSGALIDGSDYVSALRLQRSLLQTTLKAFERVDVLLTATIPGPAEVQHLMTPAAGFSAPPITNPFNIAECPAISVCNGFSPDGLPLAMQFVAPQFEEVDLLRVAAAYERATPWRDERPGLVPGSEEVIPALSSGETEIDERYRSLAERMGLSLGDTSLRELCAVMPETEALIRTVRGEVRHYGEEPSTTFALVGSEGDAS